MGHLAAPFLSRRPCTVHDDASRGWGGFLYTNYMPIYNHPCDTENEFTAWIPVITATLSSSLFFYCLLTHRRVSMWLHPVGTSRIYGQKNNNKKEVIHKNTNIHSLYETIINYPQYTVLFEKYAKMDGITIQWKLYAHRHIKSRMYNTIFMVR